MKFTKMHGCGNDYFFVDCITNPLSQYEMKHLDQIAVSYSDRKKGIGSDGMILILPSELADFRMEMYNSDGSIGQMCGNGIRCVGKYVYDSGLTTKVLLRIETRAGIKLLKLYIKDGLVESVCVNMGIPILTPEKIPVKSQKEQKMIFDYPLDVLGTKYPITCVSMGNPHTVLFLPDISNVDVKEIGSLIEHHSMFPERTNVEFVQVLDRSHIKMRVWERGSGETFACGTGACASVVACWMHQYTDHEVTVHLLGGDLFISYHTQEDMVYMTGPAGTVYHGETAESNHNIES